MCTMPSVFTTLPPCPVPGNGSRRFSDLNSDSRMTMKLYYSPTSPYVRKCLVAALELGLREKIELLPAAAHPVDRDRALVVHNPLGKVPTLITDEGAALYDSRVICDYLNSLGDARLIPPQGSARW